MSYKPFVPTEAQHQSVREMVALGIPIERVRRCMINATTGRPIKDRTFQRHFSEDVEMGRTDIDAKIGKALIKNATDHNNFAAQKWWTQARMGWSETTRTEHAGTVTMQWDLTKLTDEQLAQLGAILQALGAAAPGAPSLGFAGEGGESPTQH